jgi:hypothetical protein
VQDKPTNTINRVSRNERTAKFVATEINNIVLALSCAHDPSDMSLT